MTGVDREVHRGVGGQSKMCVIDRSRLRLKRGRDRQLWYECGGLVHVADRSNQVKIAANFFKSPSKAFKKHAILNGLGRNNQTLNQANCNQTL